VAILIFSGVLYLKWDPINTNQMKFCIGQGAFESPNGNYTVTVDIYPVGDIPSNLDNYELLPYVTKNDMDA